MSSFCTGLHRGVANLLHGLELQKLFGLRDRLRSLVIDWHQTLLKSFSYNLL